MKIFKQDNKELKDFEEIILDIEKDKLFSAIFFSFKKGLFI